MQNDLVDPLYARPRDDGKIHCNPVTRAILERTNPPFLEVTHSKCHCPPKCGLLERTMCCHHVLVNGRKWRRGCCCRVDERHITTSDMRTLRALWGWRKCFDFDCPQRSHGRYGMAVCMVPSYEVWYHTIRNRRQCRGSSFPPWQTHTQWSLYTYRLH